MDPPSHHAPRDAPFDDWYYQLAVEERLRHFWTIQRNPSESLVMFVARFVDTWHDVRVLGVTDYEAAQHLIRLLPEQWRAWANTQLVATSYPDPCTSHSVGNFPSFAARDFHMGTDPTTVIPPPVVPPLCFFDLFPTPDAVMTQPGVDPIPPPLPTRRERHEFEAGPSRVPQDDEQRLLTLLQSLPAVQEQVRETADPPSQKRARTVPADSVIPRELRIRLEEYGQPFALPPVGPADLEDHFGAIPPTAPVAAVAPTATVPIIYIDDDEATIIAPTDTVPVIYIDDDEDPEEDPEEGSSV